MFELQRDLRALLCQAAIFERIRKLIRLADAHQKLRLRDQLLRMHSKVLRRRRQRREVHIRRNVLLSRSFIRICADRMLSDRFQCSPMTSGELFLARISIVDDDHEPAIEDPPLQIFAFVLAAALRLALRASG